MSIKYKDSQECGIETLLSMSVHQISNRKPVFNIWLLAVKPDV